LNCSEPDTGYNCIGAIGVPSRCFGICGDAIRLASEFCDNGNKPGCSMSCRIDAGYTCTGGVGVASNCTTACGDSIKAGT
jgi:cysteine-rich repeat protein